MLRYFPLKKHNITINDSNTSFLLSYKHTTEIPVAPHPGSFGYVRKNHIHEGVDLYANDGDEVIAIEDGVIVNLVAFTGSIANSPWWNDTYSIMVQHKNYTLNYGELIPIETLVIGSQIKAGQIIGHIKTVLLKDKGRPMAMLHLEMYTKETLEPIKEWSLNQQKPHYLLDPTKLLTDIILNG